MKRTPRSLAWASAAALALSLTAAAHADKTVPIERGGRAPSQTGEEAHSTPPGTDVRGPDSTGVAAPGARQARLASLSGRWHAAVKTYDSSGTVSTLEGTAQNSMVRGRYLEQRISTPAGAQPFRGRVTTGYDGATGQYWSSWVDDGGNEMVVSRAAADTVTTAGMKGPDGKPMPLRTVVRDVDRNTEVVTMYSDANGREMPVLEITYTRM